MLNATKPRIACVFEHPTLSGGERSMLEVLRRLRGEFDFVAFAPPRGALWAALHVVEVDAVPFERIRRPTRGETPAELTARALSEVVEADRAGRGGLQAARSSGERHPQAGGVADL